MATRCPACDLGTLERFLDLPTVPVLSTAFHRDPDTARAAPSGDLLLALCRRCALVWNIAFDPALVEYTPDYENSQLFSPLFHAFAAGLAEHLSARYGLTGRTAVEVGSGKGEFLAMLCDAAGCEGLGFDPTFAGDVEHERVRVVREYYDADAVGEVDAALVLARHVLEHVEDPVGFLSSIRRASGPTAPVYVEVPNGEFVFSDDGMWDLLYQHVAYFSRPALEAVARRSGYEVTELRTVFHDQFLALEGAPSTVSATSVGPDPEAVARICARIETFAQRLTERLEQWRRRLRQDDAGEVALWGAGAKGVAFLNLLGTDRFVDRVIDLNPRKIGRFVPGTGHRIDAPDSLRGGNVGTVLITNPAYRPEIVDALDQQGTAAQVLPV